MTPPPPPITVTDTTPTPGVPAPALAVLEAHLPHSYSLLRRCHFTHRPRGTSEHAHYLVASSSASEDDDDGPYHGGNSRNKRHFAAAYVDLSKGPETEVFLYSTLQDHYYAEGDGRACSSSAWDHDDDEEEEEEKKDKDDRAVPLPEQEVDHVLDLIMALFRRIKGIAAAANHPLHRPHGPMVGGLHEGTYRLLTQRRGLRSSYWNPHDVWLFRLDRLPPTPPTSSPITSSMRWDVVRREDVPLIASRTRIPKVEATLMSEPSVVVRLAAGGGTNNKEEEKETLVAWGFMGIAGTLSTLHVEVRAPFFFFFFFGCPRGWERREGPFLLSLLLSNAPPR